MLEHARIQTDCCIFFKTILKHTFVRSKLKRQNRPAPYYSNSMASRRLIPSGDIEQNPGPSQQKTVEHISVRITARENRNLRVDNYSGNSKNTRLLRPLNRVNRNINKCGQPNCIKVFHLNVCSLKNRENFHQVNDLVVESDFDIFTTSETWFNASVQNKEYNIDGYKLMRLDRHSKIGGSACAYVRNSLKVRVLRQITNTSQSGLQQLWLSL